MRVWISCLLIGSITCYPVGKEYGGNSAETSSMRQPFGFPLLGLPNPNANTATGLPAPQDDLSSAGPGSYSSTTNMAAGNAFDGGYAYAGYGYSAPGGSYGSSASAYEGDSWSSGSANGYGDGNPEPVFSDVSDLEPVYSFSSRSSYQRGRAAFAQTRYTPGVPVPQPMPVTRRIGQTSERSNPAKAPTKGAF